MFEEEAEEYKDNTRIKDKNTYIGFPDERISEVQDYEGNYIDISERIIKTFKDGANIGYNKGYNKAKEEMQKNGLALQSDMDKTIEQNIALKKELNKANEWHYPSKGELPNVNQECYFIHSNTYGQQGNKPIFTKSSIQVHAGVYTNAYDEEGNETTDFCFYDDFIEEEMDINEVYAWKEIVLPKEIKEND